MPVHETALGADVAEIPRLIEWIEQILGAEGVDESPIFKVTLALEEAVMNVISHAFEGRPPPYAIRLRLDLAPGRLTAELVDNGRAFDPSAVPAPDLAAPLAQRDIGGLGLHLIRTMMDRVEYRRADGENRLVMEKTLT